MFEPDFWKRKNKWVAAAKDNFSMSYRENLVPEHQLDMHLIRITINTKERN